MRKCPRCEPKNGDELCQLCAMREEYRVTRADADPIGRLVGKAVRAARVSAGLSQAAVARAVGMPRPSIARLERGRHVPTLDVLLDVASAMGLPPSRLLASLDAACGFDERKRDERANGDDAGGSAAATG